MTEQRTQEEQPGRREILDFQNHGAVYGRFLLASLPGADTANIIDPAKRVEFNTLTVDTLKDRNYNPVAENFSLAERKEEWKEVEYSEAYSQWRTKFTGFMTKIKADSTREKALRIIMLDPKTKAADFTEANANTLFEKFCKDTSNIDAFVKSVTQNLVTDEKIDPGKLRELLPHLQWIASGLFGKNTASTVVTRLIELESELHNEPQAVLNNLNSNKDRINALKPSETTILGALYKALPPQQEKPAAKSEPSAEDLHVEPDVEVAQKIEPVIQVIHADIPRSDRVVEKPDTDQLVSRLRSVLPGSASATPGTEEKKGEELPLAAPVEKTSELDELPSSPPPPPDFSGPTIPVSPPIVSGEKAESAETSGPVSPAAESTPATPKKTEELQAAVSAPRPPESEELSLKDIPKDLGKIQIRGNTILWSGKIDRGLEGNPNDFVDYQVELKFNKDAVTATTQIKTSHALWDSFSRLPSKASELDSSSEWPKETWPILKRYAYDQSGNVFLLDENEINKLWDRLPKKLEYKMSAQSLGDLLGMKDDDITREMVVPALGKHIMEIRPNDRMRVLRDRKVEASLDNFTVPFSMTGRIERENEHAIIYMTNTGNLFIRFGAASDREIQAKDVYSLDTIYPHPQLDEHRKYRINRELGLATLEAFAHQKTEALPTATEKLDATVSVSAPTENLQATVPAEAEQPKFPGIEYDPKTEKLKIGGELVKGWRWSFRDFEGPPDYKGDPISWLDPEYETESKDLSPTIKVPKGVELLINVQRSEEEGGGYLGRVEIKGRGNVTMPLNKRVRGMYIVPSKSSDSETADSSKVRIDYQVRMSDGTYPRREGEISLEDAKNFILGTNLDPLLPQSGPAATESLESSIPAAQAEPIERPLKELSPEERAERIKKQLLEIVGKDAGDGAYEAIDNIAQSFSDGNSNTSLISGSSLVMGLNNDKKAEATKLLGSSFADLEFENDNIMMFFGDAETTTLPFKEEEFSNLVKKVVGLNNSSLKGYAAYMLLAERFGESTIGERRILTEEMYDKNSSWIKDAAFKQFYEFATQPEDIRYNERSHNELLKHYMDMLKSAGYLDEFLARYSDIGFRQKLIHAGIELPSKVTEIAKAEFGPNKNPFAGKTDEQMDDEFERQMRARGL